MMNLPLFVAQNTSSGGGGGALIGVIVTMVIYIAIIVFFLMVGWKIYAKAGQPGWAVLVPIYNVVALMQIAGKPIWWVVLYFIPFEPSWLNRERQSVRPKET